MIEILEALKKLHYRRLSDTVLFQLAGLLDKQVRNLRVMSLSQDSRFNWIMRWANGLICTGLAIVQSAELNTSRVSLAAEVKKNTESQDHQAAF